MFRVKTEVLWVLPIIGVSLVLLLYPILNLFILSFQEQNILTWTEKFNWVGLKNYSELLHSGEFWNAFKNSWTFTGFSVLIQITVGLVTAILLASKIKGIRLFRSLTLYPYMVPTSVAAAGFKWLFSGFGILPFIFIKLGIWTEPVSLFGSPDLAMIGCILFSAWKYSPFVAIMVLARLLMIPNELYEQAKIDGASSFQTFKYIKFPELKGVLLTVILLRFVWMMINFDAIYVLTGGGPINATETLPILLYNQTFYLLDLGLGSATSILIFLTVLIVSIIYLTYVRRRK